MARPSNIDVLPPEIKAWLDKALMDGNFTGYETLTKYLQQQGYHISKSGLHRYGAKLGRKLAAIRASTEAARILEDNVKDRENNLSGGVISLVQSELFETILNLQEAADQDNPAERIELLKNAAKGIAEVSRASLANKKWQQSLEMAKTKAAQDIKALGGKQGITDAILTEFENIVMGIRT
jgi:hypothetical protein